MLMTDFKFWPSKITGFRKMKDEVWLLNVSLVLFELMLNI